MLEAQSLLAQGKIVAVKGLGGFHLACAATNEEAVAELRRRKGRVDKPFALMMADMAAVEHYCLVSPEERALLESRERPIVLLWKHDGARLPIALSVAPGQRTLGVMLPYTPLHYLLFADAPLRTSHFPLRTSHFPLHTSHFALPTLVMTSGNYSEEPIATDNAEALARLAPLADACLLHDRDIHIRTDDSVVRVFAGQELPIRRSRGYAPYPVKLPFSVPPILAVGGELKNTFCVTRDRYAFLSHHIGDMENLETLESFEEGVAHFQSLFRITPEIIAHDLHPDYLSTRFALRTPHSPLRIPVQHHHAHIAACLAENGHDGRMPVIGVAFDGAGYGADGAIWGGEFLIADYGRFERAAHLAYVPLPGGDKAVRQPWRVALAWLDRAGLEWADDLPPVKSAISNQQSTISILRRQLETGLNSPPTSSMGRLFDAVSSIIGLRQAVNYEGQAAIELEAAADDWECGLYQFEIMPSAGGLAGDKWKVEAGPVIRAVAADYRAGVPAPIIAARFHNGVAAMIRDVCVQLRRHTGLNEVALSGGVFQNVTLLDKTLALLREAGFEVFTHRLVPPNDGGLALGQAVVAAVARSQ